MRIVLLAALLLVSFPSLAADSPLGAWRVVSLVDAPDAMDIGQSIQFFADGSVSGEGGCNSFGGLHSIDGERLEITNLLSTERVCDLQGIEARYFDALAAVRGWRTEAAGLILVDAAGAPLIGLAPSSD